MAFSHQKGYNRGEKNTRREKVKPKGMHKTHRTMFALSFLEIHPTLAHFSVWSRLKYCLSQHSLRSPYAHTHTRTQIKNVTEIESLESVRAPFIFLLVNQTAGGGRKEKALRTNRIGAHTKYSTVAYHRQADRHIRATREDISCNFITF